MAGKMKVKPPKTRTLPPLVDDWGHTPKQRKRFVCGLHGRAYCTKKKCR